MGMGRHLRPSRIGESGRDFGYFIVRNVAAALSNIAAAGEAIEQHGTDELDLAICPTDRVLVDAAE